MQLVRPDTMMNYRQRTAAVGEDAILLEDGTDLLLEDGTPLLLET